MKGKFFEPTKKAKMAVKILPEELTYPDTTAIWEKTLEEIATGKGSLEKFYRVQVKDLNELLMNAKKIEIKPSASQVICPSCGKAMVRRKGKNGYFWGCSGYPECKCTARDINGKADFTKLAQKAKCAHYGHI